jgi:hypothetical protein
VLYETSEYSLSVSSKYEIGDDAARGNGHNLLLTQQSPQHKKYPTIFHRKPAGEYYNEEIWVWDSLQF